MKTELTEQQINELFTFCKKRHVQYYDVQIELVDHLANAIEDMQKANPALGFSEALQTAGNQFSDDEFKEIVKSKKKMLAKQFKKMWWKEFVSYFTIPKIAVTIVAIMVIYVLSNYIHSLEKFAQIFYFVMLMVSTFFSYSLGKAKIVRQNKIEKRFNLLTVNILDREKFISLVPSFFYLILYSFDFEQYHPFSHLFYEAVIWTSPLIFIIFLAQTTVFVNQHIFIRNQYPQAFAS